MWTAEEANILGAQVGMKRSDQFQLIVKDLKGSLFHVQGTRGDKSGWRVSSCIKVGVHLKQLLFPAPAPHLDLGLEEGNTDEASVKEKCLHDRSHIKSQWLIPLIQSVVAERPIFPNKDLKELLKLYINDVFLTPTALQNTQSNARGIVFGNADKNVQYLYEQVQRLEAGGHDGHIINKHIQGVIMYA